TENSIVIAQEAAHAFGLGHVNDPSDVMFPQYASTMPRVFHDKNMAIYDLPGSSSSDCSGTGVQNDYSKMISNLGALCDTSAPRVTITSPAWGATLQSDATLEVSLQINEDRFIAGAELLVDGGSVQALNDPPWTFVLPAAMLSVGTHSLVARAT